MADPVDRKCIIGPFFSNPSTKYARAVTGSPLANNAFWFNLNRYFWSIIAHETIQCPEYMFYKPLLECLEDTDPYSKFSKKSCSRSAPEWIYWSNNEIKCAWTDKSYSSIIQRMALSLLFFSVAMARVLKTYALLTCEGGMNWPAYAKVNRICEDCYDLYNQLEVYQLCRWNISKLCLEPFQKLTLFISDLIALAVSISNHAWTL